MITIVELTEAKDILDVAARGKLWLADCGNATPLSAASAAQLLAGDCFSGGVYGRDWILVEADDERHAIAIAAAYDVEPTLQPGDALCAIGAVFQ